jgi:FtsP/CotA-like multicopper oxidase with cupredoxin domain
MGGIDEVVPAEATEILEGHDEPECRTTCTSTQTGAFRSSSTPTQRPPSALRGLKDTVLLPPGATVCPATRFSDHTDPAVAHTFHCHLRQHEDRG